MAFSLAARPPSSASFPPVGQPYVFPQWVGCRPHRAPASVLLRRWHSHWCQSPRQQARFSEPRQWDHPVPGSAAHSGSTACPTGTSPLLGGSTPGVIRVYQEGNAKPNGQGEGHQLHNRRRTSPPDEGHLWFLDLWSQPVLLMEMLIVTQKVLMEAGSEYLSFLSDLSFHLVRVQVVGRQHCVYATLIKAWQWFMMQDMFFSLAIVCYGFSSFWYALSSWKITSMFSSSLCS